jgi:hypothetical protein
MSRFMPMWLLLTVVMLNGCHVRPFWMRDTSVDLPPEVLGESPRLDEVIHVINNNTDRVAQLQTENATLKVPGIPTLRANLAFERPRNFRLRAELFQFTGQELDLGSNDELFWFWVRRDVQPAVYFARHDQFAVSPARQLVPVEPTRLAEALGLVRLDPQGRHQGPIPSGSQQFEIRSNLPSPRGDLLRVLKIDDKYGWILEQQLFDANGELLLSATADKHRYYRQDQVSLPHHVRVQVTPGRPTQMAFDVEISSYFINRLYGESTNLWTLPQIDGYRLVDIGRPDFRFPSPNEAAGDSPPTRPATYGPSGYQPVHTSSLPPYRGYNQLR